MKSNGTHIIDKLTVEVTIRDEEKESRKEIFEKVKQQILQAIDASGKTLESMYADGHYLFDSLTVDLQVDSGSIGQLDQIAEAGILKLFERSKESRKTSTQKEKEDQLSNRINREDYEKERFLYFLRNGYLPWWSAGSRSLKEMEEWLLALSAVKLRTIFISGMKAKPETMIARFCRQMSGETGREVEEKLYSRSRNILQLFNVNRELVRAYKRNASKSELKSVRKLETGLREICWLAWLKEVSGEKSFESKSLGRRLLSVVNTHIKPKENLRSEYLNRWKKEIESITGSKLKEMDRDIDLIKTNLAAENGKETGKPEKDREAAEKDFSTGQAGLVILNPFIPTLFERTECTKDGVFQDEESQERAVGLLHFLATGREEFEEPELLFEKILCGWPVESPLHRDFPISRQDKQECDELLGSVISRWEALKSTSPDGLRENFLKREGRLKNEAFGWTLHVENETHDLLLDRLPWQIGVLKFRWMDSAITVNWR